MILLLVLLVLIALMADQKIIAFLLLLAGVVIWG